MANAQITAERITRLLKGNDPAAWRDAEGNTLLHHAARLGDRALAEACLAAGIPARSYNKEDASPHDMARIWGWDTLAESLHTAMQKEKPEPLAETSLAEIRAQSQRQKTNLFHYYAHRGQFAQVIALAKKDENGLTAEDLLGTDAKGESAVFELTLQGELGLLLNRDLWIKNRDDMTVVWKKIPAAAKDALESETFFKSLPGKENTLIIGRKKRPPTP